LSGAIASCDDDDDDDDDDEFGDITLRLGLLRDSRSSIRSPRFGTNRKAHMRLSIRPNDYFTNSPSILHRYRDTAFDRPKIAIFGYPSSVYNSPTEGFPRDDLRKILLGCQ